MNSLENCEKFSTKQNEILLKTECNFLSVKFSQKLGEIFLKVLFKCKWNFLYNCVKFSLKVSSKSSENCVEFF